VRRRFDRFSGVPCVKLSASNLVIQRPSISDTPADKAKRPPTRRSPLPAHNHTRRCRRRHCLSILLDDSQMTGVSSIKASANYVGGGFHGLRNWSYDGCNCAPRVDPWTRLLGNLLSRRRVSLPESADVVFTDIWPGFMSYRHCGLSLFSTIVIGVEKPEATQTVYWRP
jgi:hypothetical protein